MTAKEPSRLYRRLAARVGPAKGRRVVEFGPGVAASVAGLLLADQGADVVKVQNIGGQAIRADRAHRVWDRGKRLVRLDLSASTGQRQAQEVVRQADIVIESLDRGTAAQVGLDYEALLRLNPQLVYCSFPGFTPGGPYDGLPAMDVLVEAVTGTLQVGDTDETPLYTPLYLASTLAGILGATAASAALLAVATQGHGRRVEVPLDRAMLIAAGRHLVRIHKSSDVDPRFMARLPVVETYPCGDGRFLQLHGTFPKFARILMTVLGHPEWADAAAEALGPEVGDVTEDAWRERIGTALLQRPALEWEQLLNSAGGVGAMCRTIDEWLELDAARDAGLIVSDPEGTRAEMVQPGRAVDLSCYPDPWLPSPARYVPVGKVAADSEPVHSNDRLSSVASSSEAATPVPRGPDHLPLPLAGTKVLDLSILLAGPCCGRTLAEFGADVTKIDDPRRNISLHSWIDVNRCKESIFLDLRSEEGRNNLWSLIATADVLVENFREGKLRRLGFDYESVHRHHPELVYGSLNAFGYRGAWKSRAGWEQVVQAATGVSVRRGGRQNRPCTQVPWTSDYGAGLLLTYGVVLALEERTRTGLGQRVTTSLASAASLMQSRYLYSWQGCRRTEFEGVDLLGESALSRLYLCEDDWIFLQVSPADWNHLTGMEEFATLDHDARFTDERGRKSQDSCLASSIATTLLSKPRSEWLSRFREAGVTAVPRYSQSQVLSSGLTHSAGWLVRRDHPGIGLVDHVAPFRLFCDTDAARDRPAPLPGADTNAVLARIGRM